MGLFSKKNKSKGDFIRRESYYIIDGEIYRFLFNAWACNEDLNKSNFELMDEYGFYVSKYYLEHNKFRSQCSSNYYDCFVACPFDMSKAVEISAEYLDIAVKEREDVFRKQFKDFKLDGTLYRAKYRTDKQVFRSIVKPKRKLVDDFGDTKASSLILEIEVLDGKSSETKREFISFYNFLENYIPECGMIVVDSSDIKDFETERYFK
jgi:hypothetical protein